MMSEEILQKVFDQSIRDITERVGGIRLYQMNAPPNNSMCTVHVGFERGLESILALHADLEVFTRLTRYMLKSEEVTFQDVEDFATDFFNVLCGNITVRLFQATKVALRFSIPTFYVGIYRPDGHREQFAIHYSSDRNEAVRLIHYTPRDIFIERGDTYGKKNHGG